MTTPTDPPQSLPALVAAVVDDWKNHDRDWTLPGFRALAVHRFGNWRMTVQPKALRAPLSVLYRAAFRHVRNHYGIELPYSTKVGRGVVIEHQGGIVVHGDAVLGDHCVIRQGVTIGMKSTKDALAAPVLGRGVDVGAGAVILGAIHVGDDATIGANAVVLADVEAGALAVGVPARVKRRASTPSASTPRVDAGVVHDN
ncbi:MAG: serine acetyltransferase [Deltaproteobacteria bacterium]|nr:serine acetyltransferase [Deltaproteobacteria bacterium]